MLVEPERTNLRCPLFVGLPVLAMEVDEQLELVGGVALQVPAGRGEGAPDAPRSLSSEWCQGDEDPAAVVRIPGALDVALRFETVDRGRGGRGAEPGLLRQTPGGHRSFTVEDVQTPSVRAVDAERLTRRFVELVDGSPCGAHGFDEIRHQVGHVLRHSKNTIR